jgi:hypothetical protein
MLVACEKQLRCLIEPCGKPSVADFNADGVYINVTGVASASKAVVVRTLHGGEPTCIAIAGDKMKIEAANLHYGLLMAETNIAISRFGQRPARFRPLCSASDIGLVHSVGDLRLFSPGDRWRQAFCSRSVFSGRWSDSEDGRCQGG